MQPSSPLFTLVAPLGLPNYLSFLLFHFYIKFIQLNSIFFLVLISGAPARRLLAACIASLFQVGESFAALADALNALTDVLRIREDTSLNQALILNAKLYFFSL